MSTADTIWSLPNRPMPNGEPATWGIFVIDTAADVSALPIVVNGVPAAVDAETGADTLL